MKDVYAVLRQKEADCERVRREVWALFLVIPLLAEGDPQPLPAAEKEVVDCFVPGTVLLGNHLPALEMFHPPLRRV